MSYTHGVTIICLSGNTGESVFSTVSVRTFSLPYSISTYRFGESLHPCLICFHAYSFSSTRFTIKLKSMIGRKKKKKEEEEGERRRRGEDTFEKVVWPDTKKYGVRHFVKKRTRGEGDEVVKSAGG